MIYVAMSVQQPWPLYTVLLEQEPCENSVQKLGSAAEFSPSLHLTSSRALSVWFV